MVKSAQKIATTMFNEQLHPLKLNHKYWTFLGYSMKHARRPVGSFMIFGVDLICQKMTEKSKFLIFFDFSVFHDFSWPLE